MDTLRILRIKIPGGRGGLCPPQNLSGISKMQNMAVITLIYQGCPLPKQKIVSRSLLNTISYYGLHFDKMLFCDPFYIL